MPKYRFCNSDGGKPARNLDTENSIWPRIKGSAGRIRWTAKPELDNLRPMWTISGRASLVKPAPLDYPNLELVFCEVMQSRPVRRADLDLALDDETLDSTIPR